MGHLPGIHIKHEGAMEQTTSFDHHLLNHTHSNISHFHWMRMLLQLNVMLLTASNRVHVDHIWITSMMFLKMEAKKILSARL